MLKCISSDVEYFQFGNLRKLGFVGHIVTPTDMQLPLSGNCGNRERVCRAVGTELSRMVGTEQVHGCNVVCVAEPMAGCGALSRDTRVPQCDALITSVPNMPLLMLTADCVPLLIADARKRVVAAVHAGWRGTAQGIASKAIEQMRRAYGTSVADVVVGIGPCIGACCFEVGTEVVQAVGEQYVVGFSANGRPMLDIAAANKAQLIEAGVPEANIELSGVCTCCGGWPSWRRDKTEQRIGSMVWIAGGEGDPNDL